MSDDLPLVLVTRALPDGWLAALDGRCTTIVGDADVPGLQPRIVEALPRAAAAGGEQHGGGRGQHRRRGLHRARDPGGAHARRARGFGLELLYAAPRRRPELEAELNLHHVPLPELLGASDFVSLHVPLTPSTRHMIDAIALQRMKPTAILINTARGPMVDPAALAEALRAGTLAGAALDVTDPEPLPPAHPLYACPNLLVVPHIGSATVGTRRRMAELAAKNVLAGLEGSALPGCVNPGVGPRR